MNLTVLGTGAWGTALGVSLSRKHPVVLWGRDPALVETCHRSRVNARYLPDVALPADLELSADLRSSVAAAELVVVATPVSALRTLLEQLQQTRPGVPLVWACKGFEHGTGFMPHEVVQQSYPGAKCGALTGPSFAQEVARGLPAAVTLASTDRAFAEETSRQLHQANLRIYYSDDLPGAEVAGAVKNVMAIATGVCEGLGLGLNARAALVTRGLAEMTRLGIAVGGRQETFMGLAGAGDLILTCTGDLSRNRRVGLELARGSSLAETLERLGHVAEGVSSAREVARLAQRYAVEMPITAAVCAILFDGKSPQDVARHLLARDPKMEA